MSRHGSESYWVGLRRIAYLGATACCWAGVSIGAQAALVDFTFSVTKPLVSASGDMLGGSATPVVFRFQVETGGPNLAAPSITDGVYPIGDHGMAGFGSVSLDGEVATLSGGLFQVSDTSQGDGLVAIVNGSDGAQLAGRSLFVAFAHLFDRSGRMFSGIELPLTDEFAAETDFGMFRLTFFPNQSDPEYGTGAYVIYDAFPIDSTDFTLTRSDVPSVPEPATFALVGAALLGVAAVRRRKLI